MTKKQLSRLALVLLTIGAGLIAIKSVQDPLRAVFSFFPTSFFTACLVIGFVLTICGVALFLIPIEPLRAAFNWLLGKAVYEPRQARREDLTHIHALGVREFGEVSPLEKMLEWHKLNRNIFHVVHSIRRGGFLKTERLIGFYSVIPLKVAAIELLDEDSFDGLKIGNNLIIKERWGERKEDPACIYIGAIVARGSRYARGIVIWDLIGRLRAENDRGVRLIYSRPVTDKGLELLEKNGFEPVKPDYGKGLKHIYKRGAPPH